jgi:hypothetical protein
LKCHIETCWGPGGKHPHLFETNNFRPRGQSLDNTAIWCLKISLIVTGELSSTDMITSIKRSQDVVELDLNPGREISSSAKCSGWGLCTTPELYRSKAVVVWDSLVINDPLNSQRLIL